MRSSVGRIAEVAPVRLDIRTMDEPYARRCERVESILVPA
jgi:hypothetical protein